MTLALVVAVLLAGCDGDGTEAGDELAVDSNAACAGLVEFHGTNYVPVGGSTRPKWLKQPKRGKRLGSGIKTPCLEGREMTAPKPEKRVLVFRVVGVKPEQAVFVGEHRELMWPYGQ